MPKTTAPFDAPAGKRWCARHNRGGGAFLAADRFPLKYNYCHDCKREYQRSWDKTTRKRTPKIVVPSARLGRGDKVIILHLPNDEKGRNITRIVMEKYPDGNTYL
jgi:hypothetical protein